MRLIFAGTPEVAVPSLTALLDSHHEVAAVITRPDAPSGRGRRLSASPVRRTAEAAGVPVLTPRSLRDADVQQSVRDLAPEAAPVVAYGALVPPGALTIPRHGWVNLHFSLLPQWRGAAPVQRAILAGQQRTGMTVFSLAEGLDTGDVLAQQGVGIGTEETAGELLDRMAHEGADLLLGALDALEDGTAQPVPQPEHGVTHAAKLTPEEAEIDWGRPAADVSAHIRGMSPDPGAWTTFRGQRLKVLGVRAVPAPEGLVLAPGALGATRRTLFAGTGGAPLALGTLAPPGRRAMRAEDWARGAGLTGQDAFTGGPRAARGER